MKPWKTLGAKDTDEGRLELRCRDDREYVITIEGRVLMSSMLHRSEVDLSAWGCGPVAHKPRPRVLTAGLGLGYTLRAALDILPAKAKVVVAELNPVVVEWCRGPVAMLSEDALSDKRVELVVDDVMECVRDVRRGVRRAFDAIVIDLYDGPGGASKHELEPVYGDAALAAVRDALTPGGVYAVWGESPEPAFERDLQRAGFRVTSKRPGGRGRHHVVYVATKP